MRRIITCIVVALCVLAVIAVAAAQVPRQNPATFGGKQWNDLFLTVAPLPLTQRIAVWADLLAVDSQYVLDPLGEGADAVPDADPLIDLQRVDCQTYVEQVYALALARDHADFTATLQRIRYRDGQIGYLSRNHYTVADWLPANAWCIRDVTEIVGANVTQPMTKTIDRQSFFFQKGVGVPAAIPTETLTTAYIPRDQVNAVLPKLCTGDLAIFVLDTPGIVAGHLGLLRVEGDSVQLQHASSVRRTVVTQPLAEYLQRAPARFIGMKVARPYSEAQ